MTLAVFENKNVGLVIVDVQGKLMEVMRRQQYTVKNIIKLLRLSKLFEIPVILTEQYPKMLGITVPEIKENIPLYKPIKKIDFDCCAVEDFNTRLNSLDLKTIILSGVETHICVFQTCLHLLKRGYTVHVPQDATDSRTEENWQVGLELMNTAGAVITSTETLIFQCLKRAGTHEFKEMIKIIK
jgi:nicotinamidase-related amidase